MIIFKSHKLQDRTLQIIHLKGGTAPQTNFEHVLHIILIFLTLV